MRGGGGRFLFHCFRRKKFTLSGIAFDAAAESVDRVNEFVDFGKMPVDRSVTEVRDFIDITQFLQHLRADLSRGDFAATRFQIVNDVVDRLFQGDQTDRSLFKSLRHAAGQLAPVERFVRPVSLHHPQIGALDLLVGSEAVLAIKAFAAAADTGTVPRLAGVDHFVITRATLGATHSVS